MIDGQVEENGVRFRFTSKILPRYLGKTKAIEELVPWLYLSTPTFGPTAYTSAAG